MATPRQYQYKVHLAHPDHPDETSTGQRISFCNQFVPAARTVDDPAEATCLRCAAALAYDADPTVVEPRVRQLAYSRATTQLRERYRDEFEELRTAALADLVAEGAT
jgi:hypothetical protein